MKIDIRSPLDTSRSPIGRAPDNRVNTVRVDSLIFARVTYDRVDFIMVDKRAPNCQLRLEWVFGYRAHQCRSNLLYTATADEFVYHVAGVGVVYNRREHAQRFYLGHDDDIVRFIIVNPRHKAYINVYVIVKIY